jgi:hypothetical protein
VAGSGYVNFMGNEFGHPEVVGILDFKLGSVLNTNLFLSVEDRVSKIQQPPFILPCMQTMEFIV